MKMFLILGLLTTQVFAVTPLMEKHVRSGYIDPEHSFAYDCFINNDRHVVITRRLGYGQPQTQTHHFSYFTKITIKSLLKAAEGGRIESLPVMCDAGDKILYGFRHGSKIILDEDQDCMSHKINRSRATAQLKSIATKLCGF